MRICLSPYAVLPLSAKWSCSACRALLHAAAPHPALATCGHDGRPIHAGIVAMTGNGRGHRRAELLARGIARRWARAVVVWCAESSSSRWVEARVRKDVDKKRRMGFSEEQWPSLHDHLPFRGLTLCAKIRHMSQPSTCRDVCSRTQSCRHETSGRQASPGSEFSESRASCATVRRLPTSQGSRTWDKHPP